MKKGARTCLCLYDQYSGDSPSKTVEIEHPDLPREGLVICNVEFEIYHSEVCERVLEMKLYRNDEEWITETIPFQLVDLKLKGPQQGPNNYSIKGTVRGRISTMAKSASKWRLESKVFDPEGGYSYTGMPHTQKVIEVLIPSM